MTSLHTQFFTNHLNLGFGFLCRYR